MTIEIETDSDGEMNIAIQQHSLQQIDNVHLHPNPFAG